MRYDVGVKHGPLQSIDDGTFYNCL